MAGFHVGAADDYHRILEERYPGGDGGRIDGEHCLGKGERQTFRRRRRYCCPNPLTAPTTQGRVRQSQHRA